MPAGRDRAMLAYLALAIVGAVVPLAAFLPWIAEHGIAPGRFVSELFSTRIGAFFGWDVVVSAVVLTLFILIQGARDGTRMRWLPIAATFLIGISCGLPLFLALREDGLRRRIS